MVSLTLEMSEPIFSEYRRDLIAKTAADFLKILFAAALASKFFSEFAMALKLRLFAFGFVLLILTLFICPMKKPKE